MRKMSDNKDLHEKFNKGKQREMIEKQISYKIKFTEQQLKELYQLLQNAKDNGHLNTDKDLILVYNELRLLFNNGNGIRR